MIDYWPLIFVYLLGSIPFGLLLPKLMGKGDVRTIGSGNIGATNVLRLGSKKLAAAVLLLDALKGAAAVWLMPPALILYAPLAVVAGHMWPVWLKFKGGKGVATTFGALLVAVPPAGVLACTTWLITAFCFRYSSLAALVALLVIVPYGWVQNMKIAPDCFEGAISCTGSLIESPDPSHIPIIITILWLVVTLKHRANIRRLLKGEETKIY